MLNTLIEGQIFYYIDYSINSIKKWSIVAISHSKYPILLVQDEITGEHFTIYNDDLCFNDKQLAFKKLHYFFQNQKVVN